MKKADIVALGLMTFSLFLGAGNVIFPPMIGQLAGDNAFMAGLGFIAGDVGLTLLALIAIAMIGGPDKILQDFPEVVQKVFWVTLFIIIGPAFVIPRAAMVAYETGLYPFVGENTAVFYGFVAVFLSVGAALTLNPQRIVATVGKWMTPVLLSLLAIIAVATLIAPQSVIEAPKGEYIDQAFSEGLIQGYLTMDALGALGFGWILAAAIKGLGVHSSQGIARYTTIAGICAAVGMVLVYSAMMYLGATSSSVAPGADNGGHILSAYVAQLFGPAGRVVLAMVITLACLTTCIGVSGAGAQYFHKMAPRISYRQFVMMVFAASAVVATVGLEKLIGLTVPVIVAFYPVTIAVIAVTLIRPWLDNPRVVSYVLSATALAFGLLDGIMAAGFLPLAVSTWLNHHLPLFDIGMGWVVPGCIALVISVAYSQRLPSPLLDSDLPAK